MDKRYTQGLKKKTVSLDKFVSGPFMVGMREYSYGLPLRDFDGALSDQIRYEKGRQFSAYLKGLGETYKQYIYYGKIRQEVKDQLIDRLIECGFGKKGA